jgi:hypothetical protein
MRQGRFVPTPDYHGEGNITGITSQQEKCAGRCVIT